MKSKNRKSQERRSGSDRRNHAVGFGFPFVDSHGHLVTHERRSQDRRKDSDITHNTGNIEQEKNYA